MADSAENETLPSSTETPIYDDAAAPGGGSGETVAPGATIGRYRIHDVVGAGGAGVVLSALDTELGRRVAIKVLVNEHAEGRIRLVREAQAMAKLSHPHVVSVHEIIRVGDRTGIVMELVDGVNLGEWRRAAPRTWRDVVGVYIQAGRGLAAAHRMGLVHRDFKPSNALIDNDGVVRVTDFGLVRAAGDSPGVRSDVADATDVSLTRSGTLLGTPAYMAPEQHAGERVDARTDQWSLACSLYEALFETRPFSGRTIFEIATSVLAGTIRDEPRDTAVPRHTRAAIRRGLARKPDDRFASVDDLVAAIAPKSRRGWVLGGAGVVAVAGAAAAVMFASQAPAIEACDGSVGELARVWGEPQMAALDQRFRAIAAPYADEARRRVHAGLEDRAALWTKLDRQVCAARRSGSFSEDMHRRAYMCLRRRLDDLRRSIEVLSEVDSASVTASVDVVSRMHPFQWCVDPLVLANDVEPPANPALRSLNEMLQGRLRRAEALERAARTADALTEVDAVLRLAEQGGDQATQLDALLIKGRILILSGSVDAAVAPLRAAESLAAAQGRIAAAVIAGARRIFAEAVFDRDLPGLMRQAESLEPWSEAVASDPLARPLLLNNLGVLQLTAKHRDRAREYFMAARDARNRLAVPDPELNAIDSSLAVVTDDPMQRAALARSAWSRARDQVGPNHLIALQQKDMYARHLMDPERALPILMEISDAYDSNHPDAIWHRIESAGTMAFYAAELGHTDQAARELERIVSLTSSSDDPEMALRRALATGDLALLSAGGASDAFGEALAMTEEQHGLGNDVARAAAMVGDGELALRAGDRRRAIARLESGVALYADVATAPEYAFRRARAQLLLAEALRERPADAARRKQLVDELRRFYEGTGAPVYIARARTLP